MGIFGKKELDALDCSIDQAVFEMQCLEVTNPGYATAVENVKSLYEARAAKEKSEAHMHPSADTLVVTGVNLLGIILILNYEKLNVVSSRAVQFLLKPKI